MPGDQVHRFLSRNPFAPPRAPNPFWEVEASYRITLATNALRSSGDVRVPATSLLRHLIDGQQFNRITRDPEVMAGNRCIRGMRVTVSIIVEMMSAGRTVEELLAGFPYPGLRYRGGTCLRRPPRSRAPDPASE